MLNGQLCGTPAVPRILEHYQTNVRRRAGASDQTCVRLDQREAIAMNFSNRRGRWARLPIGLTVSAIALALGGCESDLPGPAPAGPGAATATNLHPWLANATDTARAGVLWQFNVADIEGSYYTWGLSPDDPNDAVEIDVRQCPQDAQRLRDHDVIVAGKLIDRGKRHLPLLVAEHITPAAADDRPQLAAAR